MGMTKAGGKKEAEVNDGKVDEAIGKKEIGGKAIGSIATAVAQATPRS